MHSSNKKVRNVRALVHQSFEELLLPHASSAEQVTTADHLMRTQIRFMEVVIQMLQCLPFRAAATASSPFAFIPPTLALATAHWTGGVQSGGLKARATNSGAGNHSLDSESRVSLEIYSLGV